ncbi:MULTISPECIES: mechanosensitive ion channel family protein [unclassified Lentimicrobium]|uniref:mechanosensitive ion channel family protein n=1 Tax=unclassified Lentimicrobium TaxID=2677434 RepID=UPI001557B20F|nr:MULTISPECIES: mechanosensitive ion channel domain-containing protein [unclassified Lentimicrobium]NPD47005.1 mechanosensitive ion channel [Lentimicrobium sp. S6]NPD83902.1 mechanosensitive ion channel [Lentimicrobium sp. L6]
MLYSFYDYFDPYLAKFYSYLGFSDETSEVYANYSELLIAFVLSVIFFYLVRFLLRVVLIKAISKTKNQWDDLLLNHKVLHKASYLAPGIIMDYSVDHILANLPGLLSVVNLMLDIYFAIVSAMIINSIIGVLAHIVTFLSKNKRLPIKGISQVLKIIVYIITTIVIISFLLGKEPGAILAGLGAASAIIILIFKDAILGFVGGIQLSALDMVKEGDWISLPKHNADGTVIDISLTTVKVQNWDKTISTVPTYSLVSESVKNWRGMEESGGRRIKRSINIDMTTVKFCDQEMIDKFKTYDYLADYVDSTEKQLKEYNTKAKINSGVKVNGRRQTNLGVFRAYLVRYLRNKPEIHNDMTFIVRQLDPSEKGIPMEIYVFSRIQSWVEYEAIQSDIFDHILAAIPEFDLRVFQEPTGSDFRGVFKN